MTVKLKLNREYQWPVPWSLDDETEGAMRATFTLPTEEEYKALPLGEKQPLLELVLTDVDGLEVETASGELLQGEKLKSAIINDPELSKAFYDAFMEMWLKKSHPEILNALHSNFMELISNTAASQSESESSS